LSSSFYIFFVGFAGDVVVGVKFDALFSAGHCVEVLQNGFSLCL
jgi:hypothetical protein